jgi:glutamyl-tRNA synthetase
VPLVLGPDGDRLAKRHGAVSLADLLKHSWTSHDVVRLLLRHLGLDTGDEVTTATALVSDFRFERLSAAPWKVTGAELASFRIGPE